MTVLFPDQLTYSYSSSSIYVTYDISTTLLITSRNYDIVNHPRKLFLNPAAVDHPGHIPDYPNLPRFDALNFRLVKLVFRHQLLMLLGIILFFAPGLGQDYEWPTEASRRITATFGDIRPRRYHAGIDISTNSINGYDVYAVEDGYVERLLVSTSGYGNTLYIRQTDGRIAVYAHLQRFTPQLQQRIQALQERQRKYALDLRFTRSEFPVRRGDIIGFTGDTGTISGPHLHFELRDSNNRPINPLAYGIEFEDNLEPQIFSLAVIPLAPETIAHGSTLPTVIPAQRIGNGQYIIPDTIAVSGTFGLAVEANDLLPESNYRPTLYGLSLAVDGVRRYCVQFDSFSFDENQLVELERDYALYRQRRADFHRLFTKPANNSLSFLQSEATGELNLTPGYHRFNIKVWDQRQNVAVLRGTLAYTPPTRLTASSEWSDEENGWIVTLDSSAPLRQYHVFLFNIRGILTDQFSHRTDSLTSRQLQFVVPEGRGQRTILQIIGVDRWGARLEPVHLSLIPIDDVTLQRQFTLEIEHLDKGVVFQVSSDYYLPTPPEMLLRTSEGVHRYQTQMVSPVDFISPTFAVSQLIGLEEVIIRVDISPTYEVRLPVTGVVVPPDEHRQLANSSGSFQMEFPPGTFYDSTFVWLSHSSISPPSGAWFVTPLVKVGPYSIPYKGSAGIRMLAPANSPLPEHAGIFYLDQRNGWEFMTPAGSTLLENLIRTRTYRTLTTSGEVFALLEETDPPVIELQIPGDGGTYFRNDLDEIRFDVSDHLAGIKDETAITVTLDGQSRIFTYNISRETVTYDLPTPLRPGEHQLDITATDQLGNTATRTVIFFIE